jgi:hypothetical protein
MSDLYLTTRDVVFIIIIISMAAIAGILYLEYKPSQATLCKYLYNDLKASRLKYDEAAGSLRLAERPDFEPKNLIQGRSMIMKAAFTHLVIDHKKYVSYCGEPK